VIWEEELHANHTKGEDTLWDRLLLLGRKSSEVKVEIVLKGKGKSDEIVGLEKKKKISCCQVRRWEGNQRRIVPGEQ